MTERSRIRQNNRAWFRVIPDTRQDPAADRLDSWKDIAAYLRRDVSTVQRWEKKQGLPVHRHIHDKQGSVYAFKPELDQWWRQGTHRLDLPDERAATDDVKTPRRWFRFAAAAVVIIVAAAMWLWLAHRPLDRVEVVRSAIPLPDEAANAFPAISPDGTNLVYNTRLLSGGNGPLYIKSIHELEGRPIAGTDGGIQPFFSPDGNWIGYFAGGKLYKVSTRGGQPVALATARQPRGGTWLADDSIVFTRDYLDGLSRVTAAGSTPTVLTRPNRSSFERTHRLPSAVPGGHAVVFTVHRASADSSDDADIEAVRVATGERVLLLRGGTQPMVAPSGHLLYGRRGQIWAAPFDIAQLRVTGPSLPVIDNVAHGQTLGRMAMTLSNAGTLVYASGGGFEQRQLLWVDKAGRQTPVIETRGAFLLPRISPDGRFVALEMDSGVPRVWLLDLERGTLTRRTAGWDAQGPFWSPDGRTIGLTRTWSTADGRLSTGLMAITRDGIDEESAILANDVFGVDWSRDGSRIAVTSGDDISSDIDIVSVHGPRRSVALLHGPDNDFQPRFSPDGRWLAFASNASGRPEVYVREVDGHRRWQISADGGRYPVWSRDGTELFFRQSQTPHVMAAKIGATPDFSVTPPRRLFDGPDGFLSFDVGPDGRFIFVSGPEETWRTNRLIMVQNWFEELRQKVPVQ